MGCKELQSRCLLRFFSVEFSLAVISLGGGK